MKDRVYYLLIILLSPLLGVFIFLKNLSKKNIVFFSVVIMGTLGLLYYYGGGADGTTHYLRAKENYVDMSIIVFFSETINILFQNPTYVTVDLYIHFLYFISASILYWPESLHLLAGLILGYIIGKTFQLLSEDFPLLEKDKTNIFFIFILIGIHLIFPLNAIRIGTAMWLALYSILGYAKTKQNKYIFTLILTLTIHFAYALIIIPVFAAFILKRYKLVILGLFFISFAFQLNNVDFTGIFPNNKTFDQKSAYIQDENTIEENQQRTQQKIADLNLYASLGPVLYFQYGIFVLVVLFIPLYWKTPTSQPVFIVMSVVLLTYAFSNIVGFMPSLVGRVTNLGTVLFLVAGFMWKISLIKEWISNFYLQIIRLSHFYLIGASFLYFLARLSHVFDTTSVYFIALPLLAEFQAVDLTIREAILSILK